MAGHFIGLDLGTTSFKSAVLDLDAARIRSVRRVPTPEAIRSLPASRHELAPQTVIELVRDLLRQSLHEEPAATGVILCGQMHGLVLSDSTGRAHSNIITWKDQRATETANGDTLLASIERRLTPKERDEIGGELRSGVPITTLAAMQLDSTLPAGFYAASLPDFVLAALRHGAPTTEPTNAAAHGLYHLDRRDWHFPLIEKLGLASLRWPQIHSFRDIAGEIEIDKKRLACFTPVGDQQCALAGAALREGELSLNISTGSQISLIAAGPSQGPYLVRPYFDDRFLRTIVSIPAGRSLQLLVDLLTEIGPPNGDPWEAIRMAVDLIADTDLEVDLSFFASLTGSRGRIANIHEGNLTVGHLFAAAFRSMAANYVRCARVLSSGSSRDRLVFSGGLALRFPRLRNDILIAFGNPPSRVTATEEDTLSGLLVLALVCDGRAATVEEAAKLVTLKG